MCICKQLWASTTTDPQDIHADDHATFSLANEGMAFYRKHQLALCPMLECSTAMLKSAHHPLWECVLQGVEFEVGFELLTQWVAEKSAPLKIPEQYFQVPARRW